MPNRRDGVAFSAACSDRGRRGGLHQRRPAVRPVFKRRLRVSGWRVLRCVPGVPAAAARPPGGGVCAGCGVLCHHGGRHLFVRYDPDRRAAAVLSVCGIGRRLCGLSLYPGAGDRRRGGGGPARVIGGGTPDRMAAVPSVRLVFPAFAALAPPCGRKNTNFRKKSRRFFQKGLETGGAIVV